MKWHQSKVQFGLDGDLTWQDFKALYWGKHPEGGETTFEPYRGIWLMVYKHRNSKTEFAYSIPNPNTRLFGYRSNSIEDIKRLVDMELDTDHVLNEVATEHQIELDI